MAQAIEAAVITEQHKDEAVAWSSTSLMGYIDPRGTPDGAPSRDAEV